MKIPLRSRFLIPTIVAIAILAAMAAAILHWAEQHARAATSAAATEMARSQAGLLTSELQKFQLLPLVLPEYPEVHAALDGGGATVAHRLDAKFELVATRTNAAAIYLLDRSGTAIAASNARLPTSFVGQRYGFRPYFRDAMRNGSAQLFALGTVSGRPGLYIARRVDAGKRPLGVLVVKVEFDHIEAEWRRQTGPTFVTDRHGVVIITSRPEWRFRTIASLDPVTQAAVRETLQFGGAPLHALALKRDAQGSYLLDRARYRSAEKEVPLLDARLFYLNPVAPARSSALATARTIIFAIIAIVAIILALLHRARERRLLQVEARRALEHEVVIRTAELRETNRKLLDESQERTRADQRYRNAREELAQANRLGSIGQITAGVAHEINQPVAAIRAFAENALQFLERGSEARARANLGLIVDLTARIGTITTELRAFARRGTPVLGAVDITAVLDGALLLVGDRVRAGRVSIERTGREAGVRAAADRVRLEQILINLLQNALDALHGAPEPRIRIEVVDGGGKVRITVSDNGPGIAPALADSLFTPFATGKSNGLGLGLGIARDIAREFGGDLDLAPPILDGATFRIILRRA